MDLPKGMTSEKLRLTADWLDTYDRMGQAFVDFCEAHEIGMPDTLLQVRGTVSGDEVQRDLRHWADEIDRHGPQINIVINAQSRERFPGSCPGFPPRADGMRW